MKVRIHPHALERIDSRFDGVRGAIIDHYRDLYKRVRKGIVPRRPCPANRSRERHVEIVDGVGPVTFIFDFTDRTLITVFPPLPRCRIGGKWALVGKDYSIIQQRHDENA